jgi:hypothetical protein
MITITWVNAEDALPKHLQEVLFNKDGKYTLAKFDAMQKQFLLRTGAIVRVQEGAILWAELVDPEGRLMGI